MADSNLSPLPSLTPSVNVGAAAPIPPAARLSQRSGVPLEQSVLQRRIFLAVKEKPGPHEFRGCGDVAHDGREGLLLFHADGAPETYADGVHEDDIGIGEPSVGVVDKLAVFNALWTKAFKIE